MWGSKDQWIYRRARVGWWWVPVVLVLLWLVSCPAQAQPIRPNIFIDNVNGLAIGSASGAPEGMAPITPPNLCATTGASNTIQSVGHGLGATPVDGSASVWINTATGPRWFTLTGIPNGDTFTVQSWATPNIAVAVACVVGGRLAGPLTALNVAPGQGLCRDFSQGWTITIVNTGTDYTEASSAGACNIQGNTFGGGIGTFGREVVQGDDPANPTRLVVTYDGNLFVQGSGNVTVKIQNLEIVRNAAGTAGIPLMGGSSVANAAYTFKNITVDRVSGTWTDGFSFGGSPGVIVSSLIQGPFTTRCANPDDDDLIINTVMLGCSGSTAAFSSGAGATLFSIIDNGGANQVTMSGGGTRMYNTFLNAGGSGLAIDPVFDSFWSGNLIGEGATLSGACWVANTAGDNLLGRPNYGTPSNFWGGNAANTCTTARYSGGLSASSMGAATDINLGGITDPLFANPGLLNYFPDNTDLKSGLVFPGDTFPLLTPALPISTMTVGASQRQGGGVIPSYAY